MLRNRLLMLLLLHVGPVSGHGLLPGLLSLLGLICRLCWSSRWHLRVCRSILLYIGYLGCGPSVLIWHVQRLGRCASLLLLWGSLLLPRLPPRRGSLLRLSPGSGLHAQFDRPARGARDQNQNCN